MEENERVAGADGPGRRDGERPPMDFYDMLLRVAHESGMSLRDVSMAAGRTPAYVSSRRCRGNVPRIDTAADLLAAVGWELCAVPGGDVPYNGIEIEPAPWVEVGAALKLKQMRRLEKLDREREKLLREMEEG